MTRSPLFLAPVLASLLFLPAARADVPPEPGYVESCTVEKQRAPGEVCDVCRAWHGDPDACAKTLGKDGYGKRCQTRGASAWGEIWCKKAPGAPAAPAPAAPAAPAASPSPAAAPRSGGCTVAGASPGGVAAVLAVLVALRSRRRRA